MKASEKALLGALGATGISLIVWGIYILGKPPPTGEPSAEIELTWDKEV